MRNLKSAVILLFLLVSWLETGSKNVTYSNVVADNSNCTKTVTFGAVEFCLPKIDGMTECYLNPLLRRRADEFAYEGNTVFGIYLPDAIYNQSDKLLDIKLDDYIKIYSVDKLKNFKITTDKLDTLQIMMLESYDSKDWTEVENSIENMADNLSIAKPILIDSYKPHENIRTSVILMKAIRDGFEAITMMTMNVVVIKNRLIYYCYYLDYTGPETLNKVKIKNDYYGLALISVNKI